MAKRWPRRRGSGFRPRGRGVGRFAKKRYDWQAATSCCRFFFPTNDVVCPHWTYVFQLAGALRYGTPAPSLPIGTHVRTIGGIWMEPVWPSTFDFRQSRLMFKWAMEKREATAINPNGQYFSLFDNGPGVGPLSGDFADAHWKWYKHRMVMPLNANQFAGLQGIVLNVPQHIVTEEAHDTKSACPPLVFEGTSVGLDCECFTCGEPAHDHIVAAHQITGSIALNPVNPFSEVPKDTFLSFSTRKRVKFSESDVVNIAVQVENVQQVFDGEECPEAVQPEGFNVYMDYRTLIELD